MKRSEVQEFLINLEDHIFSLHEELKNNTYVHSHYTAFYVNDPKLRHIHKASVRDRLVHHAVFRVLYPIFDKQFIYDSYSCREGKGTHRAVARLRAFIAKASANNTRLVYALKCDVKKFFDSIDKDILFELISRRVGDERALGIVRQILDSFEKQAGVGLPLGNVTSQLFANIYLNELDQFVKHRLKAKYYLRYCDDFITLGDDKASLKEAVEEINDFLKHALLLSLHPRKITIRSHRQGIDFLGYVVSPYHQTLRTKTKQRIFNKALRGINEHSLLSFLGVFSHCSGYSLKVKLSELKAKNDKANLRQTKNMLE